MKIVPIKIDECNEENWEEKEIYYIQKYKNEGFKLLNIDKGGNGVVTAEKRSKSSLARCGEKHWKSIVAFNLDGSFYKEYPSITAANKEFGSRSMFSIGNVLRGPGKSAFGYIWKYKSECTEE